MLAYYCMFFRNPQTWHQNATGASECCEMIKSLLIHTVFNHFRNSNECTLMYFLYSWVTSFESTELIARVSLYYLTIKSCVSRISEFRKTIYRNYDMKYDLKIADHIRDKSSPPTSRDIIYGIVISFYISLFMSYL